MLAGIQKFSKDTTNKGRQSKGGAIKSPESPGRYPDLIQLAKLPIA